MKDEACKYMRRTKRKRKEAAHDAQLHNKWTRVLLARCIRDLCIHDRSSMQFHYAWIGGFMQPRQYLT